MRGRRGGSAGRGRTMSRDRRRGNHREIKFVGISSKHKNESKKEKKDEGKAGCPGSERACENVCRSEVRQISARHSPGGIRVALVLH